MNKEIKKLENIIANVHPFYVETIAEQLYNKGYAKFDRAEWVKREDFDKVVEENKNLKESLENDFTFETTNGGKMNVLDMVKKQAIKEFVEKLGYYIYDLPNNTQMKGIETNAIKDLLKEYGVELWNTSKNMK